MREPNARVVLLVDFDGQLDRIEQLFPDLPDERVFVLGALDEPEVLRRQSGLTYEQIGRQLAEDCRQGGLSSLWQLEQLRHNERVLQRALETLREILFRPS